MILHVTQAEYKGDFLIWLRFNDGAEGIVNLKDDLYGEMFEVPHKDKTKFNPDYS